MTSVSPRPDAPLLARLKQGEPAAFDAVYDQWRPRLFNFLSRQCRDRTLAEDLVQETFLRLASHRERLRDDTDLGAWLFTAARNLAVSHGRWQRLTGTLLSALGLEKEKSAHQGDHAFEQVALQQSVSRLELALAACPPTTARCCCWWAWRGWSRSWRPA